MEKRNCAFQQIVDPKTSVGADKLGYNNKTKNKVVLCNGLITYVSLTSPTNKKQKEKDLKTEMECHWPLSNELCPVAQFLLGVGNISLLEAVKQYKQ